MKVRFAWGMVAFAVLAGALWMTPFGQAAALFAIVCAIGALANWAMEVKGRDPYDLRTLQEVHDNAAHAVDEDELNAYDPSGNVVCLCCGEEYDSRLGLCPRCKKSQF